SSSNRKPRKTDSMIAAAAQTPAISGYRVERLIGEGGFGQVWRATRDADGAVVAVKLLHLELVRSNDALTRFDRELQAIERLNHRNLVRPLDHGGPSLTSSRSMLGTPAAMAPEQMRGQAVDARTDVYALGLLAFHMLTGAPAFTGAPGVVQSYLQVHGPRPRPSAHVD